jgi:hypothetical protein
MSYRVMRDGAVKTVKKALNAVIVLGVWLAAIRLGTSSVISADTWRSLSGFVVPIAVAHLGDVCNCPGYAGSRWLPRRW